jgi:voltage-gated potassium channel
MAVQALQIGKQWDGSDKNTMKDDSRRPGWKASLHEIIFEADTPGGKAFDIGLLVAIVISVMAVLLESVAEVRAQYGSQLRALEWFLTLLFTVEYLLRLVSIGRPLKYAMSFYGIIDLLAILPTYLSIIIAGSQSLLVIRALRLLRIFRILKLAHFVGAASMLRAAIYASTRKIIVFLAFILTLMLIVGSLMYLIEGGNSGFTSIPQSIYWAVVTMTTVGYGDIAPATVLGKILASVVMILGYGIIAVPTGIVTVELAQAGRKTVSTQSCPECATDIHDPDANFCRMCGARL